MKKENHPAYFRNVRNIHHSFRVCFALTCYSRDPIFPSAKSSSSDDDDESCVSSEESHVSVEEAYKLIETVRASIQDAGAKNLQTYTVSVCLK